MVLYLTLDLAWIRTKNSALENGKAIVLWIIYSFFNTQWQLSFSSQDRKNCNSFLPSFCLPQMATQIWMDILPLISPVAGGKRGTELVPFQTLEFSELPGLDVPWFLPSNSPPFIIHQSVDSLNLIQQSTTKTTQKTTVFLLDSPVLAQHPFWPHNLIKVTALSL